MCAVPRSGMVAALSEKEPAPLFRLPEIGRNGTPFSDAARMLGLCVTHASRIPGTRGGEVGEDVGAADFRDGGPVGEAEGRAVGGGAAAGHAP